jgi:hypothetical protein
MLLFQLMSQIRGILRTARSMTLFGKPSSSFLAEGFTSTT